jgi:peptidoglycan/xylan/chitin deacetylase (PgdA/CDA1 family)
MRHRSLFLVWCLLLLGACAPALQEAKGMKEPDARASEDFVVVVAREGDTAETLAKRYLGKAERSWVITDFRDGAPIKSGDVVVIPLRPRRLGGIDGDGHQVVPVLTYHDIEPVSKNRFAITTELFEQQLKYLKENGYVGITLDELDRFLRYEQPLPKKAVVITIDDGYKSAKTIAAPLLKRYGFPAIFFIYTDFIGGGKNALSWDELRELKAEGFDVQGHSKTHSNLAVPPANENSADRATRLDAEIVATKQLMEKRIGADVRYFAYPYGGYDPDVVAKVKAAGYQVGFGTRKGSNPFFMDRYRLKRYNVFMEKDLTKFVQMLQTFEKD